MRGAADIRKGRFPQSPRGLGCIAVLCAVVMGACVPGVERKPELRLELRGPLDLNEGIPCNLVIRAVSPQLFRGESHAQISRLVAQADGTVLHSGILYAQRGRPYQESVVLLPPRHSGVAVYVLFTSPTGSWRLLLEPPLPARLRIKLGRSSILGTESY